MKTIFSISRLILIRPGLALMLAAVLPGIASAQVSLTWSADGSGGSGTWDAGITPDWYNGSAVIWPATSSGGDTAYFAGTAGNVSVASGGAAATTLFFTADGFDVGGSGTLTLDGSLTVPTIDVGSGLTATINSVIAGTNGFSKVDTGKLILGGSNTFSGNISFGPGTGGGPSEGVIQITQAAALGVVANNVNNGVTNQIMFIRDTGDLLELNGANANITLPNYLLFVTSGPNGVIRNVAGSNTITGNILLSTGVSDTGILSDGGSLTLAGGINPGSSARNLILMGTNNLVNTISGVISNASNGALLGVIKKSANSWNTWMLTGSNTYGGPTVVGVNTASAPYVTNGILRLANSSAIGTSNLVVYGGYEAGRVEFAGNITITNPISLYGRQGFTYPGLSSFSGTNVLSGPINVTANGSRVTFESQAGLLTVSGSDMTGNSGRVLTLVGNGNGVFAKNATPVVVGSLNKLGNGTWTLNGTNNYTGTTSVSAGQLQFAREISLYSNTPSSWAATNIIVSSGATLAFNVGGAGEFTSSDIATLAALGSPTNGFLTGAILRLDTSDATSDFLYATNLVNPNGTNVLSFVKSGANRLVLSGNNSHSGGTTVSGGTLVAASTSALGAAGRTVTFNGTTVDFATDTSANAYVLNIGGGYVGTVIVDRATAGAGITQAMGTATIANGTLNVQAGANVTSGMPTLQFTGIQLSAGATGFGTATLNPTTANISIIGTVSRPGAAATSLTLGGTSTGNIISGGITNNGASLLSVIKTNSSTWTLSGANTYTGPTIVSQGILNVTGSLTNTAVTNSGGTLTGTGVINGPVAIASGTLSPGVSSSLGETLTINNNLTINGTALVQIGKSGTTPVNDSIIGVTNITYGGTLIVTNATGATIMAGDAFVLFSASGTKTGNFTNIVVQPSVAGLTNSFNPTNGTLTFSSTVVTPPALNFTNTGGGSLQFSWTGSFKLQTQTNTLSTGLGTNWGDYPGGGSSPVNVTVDPLQPSVFFRLSQ